MKLILEDLAYLLELWKRRKMDDKPGTYDIIRKECQKGIRLWVPGWVHFLTGSGEIMVIETYSAGETYALGENIGKAARPGQVYTLTGDLGVGKTVFTQGVAGGLGITEPVSSPTFTIVQVYDTGRLPFYHFDVYRIGDVEEMEEIGYEDYFYGTGVCLIEWADLIREILPETLISVTIEKDLEKGFDYRKITIEGMEDL